MSKEIEKFNQFLAEKKLRHSNRRNLILDAFLKEEGHISAEELYLKAAKIDPSLGISTVYRTLKLLQEAGLANQRQFGTGEAKYEHCFFHKHHDHLICEVCGKIIEFENKDIENIQENIAQKHNFKISSHRLELYGICDSCNKS